jgi:hypothetical protein
MYDGITTHQKPFHNVILSEAKNLGSNLDLSAAETDRDVSLRST